MEILILQLLLSAQLYAAPKMICAYDSAREHKPYVETLPGSDKLKHCTISCAMALDCGTGQSTVLGIVKEIWDAMGNGNPELADIRANLKGIKLSKRSDVGNIYDCLDQCKKHY
jgi:hypothetical protein